MQTWSDWLDAQGIDSEHTSLVGAFGQLIDLSLSVEVRHLDSRFWALTVNSNVVELREIHIHNAMPIALVEKTWSAHTAPTLSGLVIQLERLPAPPAVIDKMFELYGDAVG